MKDSAGSGSGSMKMSRWSKAATSLQVVGAQHGVAEHVARHVADADDGHRLGLHVDLQLGEVVADGHPRAPGGDAEPLVVVAVGPARGEGVAQPEAPAGADRVGQVGEARRPLVGGHDQVGVVAVPPAGDGDHVVADHVVGDLEQAGDEDGVGLGGVGGQLPAGADRRLLDDEAALGPGGHDDRVLEHLGPHEVEHLAAVVVDPVAPADAAPGHRPPAQVDALHRRPVHEISRYGTGRGTPGHRGAVELEGQVVAGPAGSGWCAGWRRSRARKPRRIRSWSRRATASQWSRHRWRSSATTSGPAAALGSKRAANSSTHGGGDRRVLDQHLVDVAGRERGADLAAVAAVGPQHGDVVPGQLGPQDQAVQGVDLGPAVPEGEGGARPAGRRRAPRRGCRRDRSRRSRAGGRAPPRRPRTYGWSSTAHRPRLSMMGRKPDSSTPPPLVKTLRRAGGPPSAGPGPSTMRMAIRAGEEGVELHQVVDRPLDGHDVAIGRAGTSRPTSGPGAARPPRPSPAPAPRSAAGPRSGTAGAARARGSPAARWAGARRRAPRGGGWPRGGRPARRRRRSGNRRAGPAGTAPAGDAGRRCTSPPAPRARRRRCGSPRPPARSTRTSCSFSAASNSTRMARSDSTSASKSWSLGSTWKSDTRAASSWLRSTTSSSSRTRRSL